MNKYKIYQGADFVNVIVATEDFVVKYCQQHGCSYELAYIPQPEPEPMTQAEVEEMLLDQEYRILLLEYGLEDDEEVF